MIKPANNDPCFFTQQLFLIGTYDEDGTAHFAPISWISYTWGEPSCLVISMDGKKQTKDNVNRTGKLSATVATPDMLPFVESCNESTRNPDKIVTVETEKGKVVDVPLIANAKFSYECEILKTVDIGEVRTYFAEIKNINVREDIQKLEFYDLREINPVIYSPWNYFTVGEHLGAIGDYSTK